MDTRRVAETTRETLADGTTGPSVSASTTPLKHQILHPKHPERICWGCDRYCPADDLACGNGTIRTAHLAELFGDDWLDWAERRGK